jgi:hypothetical protein
VLRETEPRRKGRSLLITTDEFEILERIIREGLVDASVIEFLRGLIQRHPWCVKIRLTSLHLIFLRNLAIPSRPDRRLTARFGDRSRS